MAIVEPVTARRIVAEADVLEFELADGEIVRVPWERCSAILAAASPVQRSKAELSPSGYGIHWPLLDEDLSIRGLLRMVGHRS
jgi:hypothetical protein